MDTLPIHNSFKENKTSRNKPKQRGERTIQEHLTSLRKKIEKDTRW